MPAPARIGANLQIFRVERTIEDVGEVVVPTGVLTVSTIGDGFIVGIVTKEYQRIQPGDLVRPLPSYTPREGVYAQEISGGSEAMVMGFAGTQVLNDLGHIAFLDLGSDDGVTIGDEFVLYGRAIPTAREGSLQVVGVTAMAKPLSGEGPLGANQVMLLQDGAVMVLSALLMIPVLRTGHLVSRKEGVILLVLYAGYITWTVLRPAEQLVG